MPAWPDVANIKASELLVPARLPIDGFAVLSQTLKAAALAARDYGVARANSAHLKTLLEPPRGS